MRSPTTKKYAIETLQHQKAQTQPLITYEAGVIEVNHQPIFISFKHTYTSSVVVAEPPTYNGPQPCIVRITSVNSTGFTIMVQEWDYLDG